VAPVAALSAHTVKAGLPDCAPPPPRLRFLHAAARGPVVSPSGGATVALGVIDLDGVGAKRGNRCHPLEHPSAGRSSGSVTTADLTPAAPRRGSCRQPWSLHPDGPSGLPVPMSTRVGRRRHLARRRDVRVPERALVTDDGGLIGHHRRRVLRHRCKDVQDRPALRVAGSNGQCRRGRRVPQFHHDAQLSGLSGAGTHRASATAQWRRRAGYLTVASDGGIFAFGRDSAEHGKHDLNKPVVGMAAVPVRAATGWWPRRGSVHVRPVPVSTADRVSHPQRTGRGHGGHP